MVRTTIKSLLIQIIVLLILILPTIVAAIAEFDNNKNSSDITNTLINDYTPISQDITSLLSDNTDSISKEPVTSSHDGIQNKAQVSKLSNQVLREVYSDRIRFTGNTDGTTTAEFYIKPVFYKNDEGIQQFIDTTLERSELDYILVKDRFKETYQYQSIKNNLKIPYYLKYLIR